MTERSAQVPASSTRSASRYAPIAEPWNEGASDLEQPTLVAYSPSSSLRCKKAHRGFGLARQPRKLAAILAADVVGYSGRDEHCTLMGLKAHRTERLEPVVAHHGDRLAKLIGDGVLVGFPSAVDTPGVAIEFQQVMAEANAGLPACSILSTALTNSLGPRS